jgi:hypothetical protein
MVVPQKNCHRPCRCDVFCFIAEIIWWNKEFNPVSFLSLNNFSSEEAFIKRVIEIDQDENACYKLLSEPYFHNNTPNEYYDENLVLSFFERILNDRRKPVSQRRKYWHPWRFHLVKGMRPAL